jgi:membrane protein YdbS with pleckstrin-like domain
VGYLVGIPVILAYVHYYKQTDIFSANQAIVAILVVILLLTLLVKPKPIPKSEMAEQLPPQPTI